MEARVIKTNTILLVLSRLEDEELIEDFCGMVLTVTDRPSRLPSFSTKTVYLCGEIAKAAGLEIELKAAARVMVVRELSHYDENKGPGRSWTWAGFPSSCTM